jgi:hypothetical protein
MRLLPIPLESLNAELRQIHDDIASLVTEKQNRIAILNEQGSLIGPFPAMLHFPQFGVPALLLHRALSAEAHLPKTVREVAILTVGAAFGAQYEIYAHEIAAAEVGLSPCQIATLRDGSRLHRRASFAVLNTKRPHRSTAQLPVVCPSTSSVLPVAATIASLSSGSSSGSDVRVNGDEVRMKAKSPVFRRTE